MIPRILLVNDNRSSNGLATALRRRGAVVTTAPLSAVAFDTTAPAGLVFPGLGKRLPNGVLVRSITAGSFEAITRRLGVLHALARHGVPVWNSAQAIERCVDKAMTSFLLQQAGLPTPATFTVEGIEAARAIAAKELRRGPLVLKPLFGAQGRGIRLVETLGDLPEDAEVAGVFYLQRYAGHTSGPHHDFRVFVCGGQAIAMMERQGQTWITNINRGGTPAPMQVGDCGRLAALAVAAAKAVGADFCGVDILPATNGELLVLEVNSMPAWSGLQSVTRTSIAGAIAEAFLTHVRQQPATTAPRPIRFVSPANG